VVIVHNVYIWYMRNTYMAELKQFDKVFVAEDVLGGCCLDGLCEHLNIKDIEEKE